MPAQEFSAARWHKSSYSSDKANCVEVAFVKSSYSTDQANCVEVAMTGTAVAVRDSKAPAAGTLLVSPGAWAAFTAALSAGELGTGEPVTR